MLRADPLRYEIRAYRLRHFAGITVRQEAGGETVIVDHFRDQPALYGLLSWLHGLGVTLLLVKRLQDDRPPPASVEEETMLEEMSRF